MADILTRREARQQARQNRGYNRGQFQLAMANAKNALRDNTDLRGRELRQTARRMVAGVGEYGSAQNIVENATQNLPDAFDGLFTQPIKYTFSTGQDIARDAIRRGIERNKIVSQYTNDLPLEKSVEESLPAGAPKPPITPRYTDGYDFTSERKFDNAFAAARKAGLKTFMWNGKSYGTNTDPNWRERWGRKPKSVSSPVSNTENSDTASGSTGSSVKPIVHQDKPDNWNVKDLLPEDFYNELNKSLETGIDEEINNVQNQNIQSIIDNNQIDLGPTMKSPAYMGYYDGGWRTLKKGNAQIDPDNFTWTRGFKNGKIRDQFVSKNTGEIAYGNLPEDLQKVYAGSKFYRDSKTGYVRMVPLVTADPKTDPNLYRKQVMARMNYIMTNPSYFFPREVQFARENLPLYQKRYGNQ